MQCADLQNLWRRGLWRAHAHRTQACAIIAMLGTTRLRRFGPAVLRKPLGVFPEVTQDMTYFHFLKQLEISAKFFSKRRCLMQVRTE